MTAVEDFTDDAAFTRSLMAEIKRSGIRAVKTVWLFHGHAYKKFHEVPHGRRRELIDSLRLLPDLKKPGGPRNDIG